MDTNILSVFDSIEKDKKRRIFSWYYMVLQQLLTLTSRLLNKCDHYLRERGGEKWPRNMKEKNVSHVGKR